MSGLKLGIIIISTWLRDSLWWQIYSPQWVMIIKRLQFSDIISQHPFIFLPILFFSILMHIFIHINTLKLSFVHRVADRKVTHSFVLIKRWKAWEMQTLHIFCYWCLLKRGKNKTFKSVCVDLFRSHFFLFKTYLSNTLRLSSI